MNVWSWHGEIRELKIIWNTWLWQWSELRVGVNSYKKSIKKTKQQQKQALGRKCKDFKLHAYVFYCRLHSHRKLLHQYPDISTTHFIGTQIIVAEDNIS